MNLRKTNNLLNTLVLGASSVFFLIGGAHAQGLAGRGPMRIVVPFAAGGGSDVMARNLAEKFTETLRIPVLVDNRPGAGGAIAVKYVKAQPGDGMTILLGTTSEMIALPLVNKTADYLTSKDFRAIGQMGVFAEVVVTSRKDILKFDDWIKKAQIDDRTGAYGVPTSGGVAHILGATLNSKLDAKLAAVPYRGSGPLMNDILGGTVATAITTEPSVRPYASSQLRVLAVNGSARLKNFPDTPTFGELGYAGFDFLEWVGLFAPASTPPATLKILSNLLESALAQPDMAARFDKLLTRVEFLPHDKFEGNVKSNELNLGEMVKKSNIAIE